MSANVKVLVNCLTVNFTEAGSVQFFSLYFIPHATSVPTCNGFINVAKILF